MAIGGPAGYEIYYETEVEWEINLLNKSTSVTPIREFEVDEADIEEREVWVDSKKGYDGAKRKKR